RDAAVVSRINFIDSKIGTRGFGFDRSSSADGNGGGVASSRENAATLRPAQDRQAERLNRECLAAPFVGVSSPTTSIPFFSNSPHSSSRTKSDLSRNSRPARRRTTSLPLFARHLQLL